MCLLSASFSPFASGMLALFLSPMPWSTLAHVCVRKFNKNNIFRSAQPSNLNDNTTQPISHISHLVDGMKSSCSKSVDFGTVNASRASVGPSRV